MKGKGDSVLSCIICEGNEIFVTLACSDGGWPPYIGMYKVSEVCSWRADPDFRDWLASGLGICASIAVHFLGVQIQFDSYDHTAVD